MKKNIATLFFLMTILLVFPAHNFTINDLNEANVSLGDELIIYFEYESVGNTANLSFNIEIPFLDQADLDFLQFDLVDGGSLDISPIDGIFQGSITAFWQPPTGLPITLSVTDEEQADTAVITFIPLDTNYSISGKVLEESNYGINLPVFPALVNVFYNTTLEDIEEIDLAGDWSQFFSLFTDRYIISGMNSLSFFDKDDTTKPANTSKQIGYSINIPDDIEEVPCVIYPISLLNFESNYISPSPYFGTFSGHVNDIDFIYSLPDGILTGTISDISGNPISEAGIQIYSQNNDYINFTNTDSNGNFSFALENGTYNLSVITLLYQPYFHDFTINNQDLVVNITLEAVDNQNNDVPSINDLTIETYPNPFSQNLKIKIQSSKSIESATIYNLKGQVIKNFSTLNQQTKTFIWDGTNNNNQSVANGIYYLQIQADEIKKNQKVILIK